MPNDDVVRESNKQAKVRGRLLKLAFANDAVVWRPGFTGG
jgi:hypothetical protein